MNDQEPDQGHDYTVNNNGPRGHKHACCLCWTCNRAFHGYTIALATKAHRDHITARQED